LLGNDFFDAGFDIAHRFPQRVVDEARILAALGVAQAGHPAKE